MSDSLISTQGTESTQENTESMAAAAESRPEWLPEKFWVENRPAYELLAKSYGELETKFRSKEDDLRDRLIEELSKEALSERPESPDKYELPAFEGIDTQEIAQHPITKWWSEFAFENGYDNETFQKGIEMYLQARMGDAPNPEAEMKSLGDNAKARTEAVGLWVGKNFQSDEIDVIERICTTAAGVKVMERIMKMMNDSGDESILRPGMAEETTEADINKMMQDRRYWSPTDRDPAYIQKVEKFFQKKYGTSA